MNAEDAMQQSDDRLMPEDHDEPSKDNGSVAAWEEVRAGRYRPRRIKGSCLGRELG